jgi:hypothetical protein
MHLKWYTAMLGGIKRLYKHTFGWNYDLGSTKVYSDFQNADKQMPWYGLYMLSSLYLAGSWDVLKKRFALSNWV